MLHQLGEDSLADIHSSLSAIATGWRWGGCRTGRRRNKFKSNKPEIPLDH
jgi:hypothetical protein